MTKTTDIVKTLVDNFKFFFRNTVVYTYDYSEFKLKTNVFGQTIYFINKTSGIVTKNEYDPRGRIMSCARSDGYKSFTAYDDKTKTMFTKDNHGGKVFNKYGDKIITVYK